MGTDSPFRPDPQELGRIVANGVVELRKLTVNIMQAAAAAADLAASIETMVVAADLSAISEAASNGSRRRHPSNYVAPPNEDGTDD